MADGEPNLVNSNLENQNDTAIASSELENSPIENHEVESSVPFEYNAEAAANVSSAIMFKVPTKALATLRETFESANGGLNLIQFLEAFVRNMDLDEDEEELLRSVPDLLDFFKSVDINGDGRMEWSEFVAFVIESVVSSDPPVIEKFVNVNRHPVQSAGQRQTVKASKFMPEFNRLFVGIGSQIVIYETDDKSDTWLSSGVRINLIARDASGQVGATQETNLKKKEKESGPRTKVDTRLQQNLCALDFVYLTSRETLIVLRSDICLEFHKFMTRSKVHADMILQNGIWPLTQPYNKLALRETRTTPWRLFAIGENRQVVDSWQVSVGISGAVELSDYQALEKHTDFLRDVLVIHNDLYDLLVTCGMDKKVLLWDLTTLRYRATRSGHSGGVQCLAFDDRSILFAGGFNFNIIGWDLDAEIDRPIFQLWGHTSVITKIVAIGSISRAFSLDTSGRVRLWDTSKSNPNDKEARQIDEVYFTEDTFRCIDVLRNVSTKFPSAHRVIVNIQGRRNHVYKLVDMAPLEAAPLPGGVLFSSSLLMMLTLHSKDILFFSAVTGSEQNKLDRVMLGLEHNPGNEVQVGVLDDRERKLIVGDSVGCIAVYNCLSCVRLKTLATQIPFSCRFMLYTHEKLVIAIAGPGELYIFDELPNFPTADTTLRDTRAHEVDVVAVAYSFELGLIATADCTGVLCIWSFEFISLEAIIRDCVGTEIGQISFIGKFPLLLVTDSLNNFSIVGVGPAFSKYGKTIWRVESEIFVHPACRTSKPSDLYVLGLDADEREELAEREAGVQDEAVGGTRDSQEDEEEEEADQSGTTPMTKKQINEYLRTRRDCKSISILIQKSEVLRVAEATTAALADPNTRGQDIGSDEYSLDQLLGDCNPNRVARNKQDEPDEELEAAFLAAISGTNEYHPEDENKEKAPQGATVSRNKKANKGDGDSSKSVLSTSASKGFPRQGVRVLVLCGYDDGSVTVTDLTPSMLAINLGELEEHEFASKQPGYNPRRFSNRKVTDYDRNVWTREEIADRERYVGARLSLAWVAHGSAVTTLKVVCDNDILTGSADMGVYLWTLEGKLKATLTRGREWDKTFRPHWVTPVDMERRELQRRHDAHLLVNFLGLRSLMKRKRKVKLGEKEKELIFGENEESAHGSEAASEVSSRNADAEADAKSMIRRAFAADGFHDSRDDKHEEVHQNRHEYAHVTDQSVVSHLSVGEHDVASMNEDPDRVRVVGQLHGKITYHLSNKDAAKSHMSSKQAESMAALNNIGKVKKKLSRVRKGGGFGSEWEEPEEVVGLNGRTKVKKSVAARYLDDLMSVSSSGVSVDGMSAEQLAEAAATALGQGKPRKIRTKYDIELAQMDADDPNNWEIHSSNRQRALYHRLYLERDKKGYTKDPMAIYEAKLNALSPGGDFREYMRGLLAERSASLDNRRSTLDVSVDVATVNVCNVQLGEVEMHSHLLSSSSFPHGAPSLILKSPEPILRRPPTPIGLSLNATEIIPDYKPVPIRSQSQPVLEPVSMSAGSRSKMDRTNHRLTPAQLEAIRERQAILLLDAQFDKTLFAVDRISKIATKKMRRKKLEYRRMARSMSEMALMEPLPPVFANHIATTKPSTPRHEIHHRQSTPGSGSRQRSRNHHTAIIGAPNNPMTALVNSLLEVAAVAAPYPTASPMLPNTRHMAATILLDKQTSIDGVMEMSRKQKAAELNWVRKVKTMLTQVDTQPNPGRRRQKKQKDQSVSEDQSVAESLASSVRSIHKTKRHQVDKKIGERKSFGPYTAKELLGLLKAFQSLPQVYVPPQPRDNSIIVSHVLHEEHQEQRALDIDDAWSEEDEEEEEQFPEGAAVADPLDPAVAQQETQKLLLEQQQALEAKTLAEKRRQEDEEDEREKTYSDQVLSTSIKLQPLRNHPFMKLRPAMKAALDTYIAQRGDDGTLPHNVICALSDLLSACCPIMKPDDRQQCLRLFVINTPSQDVSEAAERGVTVAQLQKLKDMFKFFDKDGSGGIDKEEILEVLLKLQENSNSGSSQEIGEDLIKDVMGTSGEELSFEDFARSFKSLVQSD